LAGHDVNLDVAVAVLHPLCTGPLSCLCQEDQALATIQSKAQLPRQTATLLTILTMSWSCWRQHVLTRRAPALRHCARPVRRLSDPTTSQSTAQTHSTRSVA
jgi:hypothetical protein